jgi:Protein of unknown function VcgC/VcgE (DUF2780)
MTVRRLVSIGTLLVGFCATAVPSFAQAAPAELANPELANALAGELGTTPQKAEGAAGAIFGLAKTRLSPEQFAQVSGAVPGMNSLLKAAPVADAKAGGLSALAGAGGSALGGLAALAGPFSQLGLKPEMALKAVPVVTKYVSKMGGANVGSLLAGVLK